MTRGEDSEKNKALIPTIKAFDELIEKANGKYLFGTDEPTLLDVWFAPFLETFYDFRLGVMNNILVDSEFDVHGTHIGAYVEKFRGHELVNPWYMNPSSAARHWERTRGWRRVFSVRSPLITLLKALVSHLASEFH